MTETRSTCPYCGVGCGVIIESAGAQITGVRGDPEHPANFGRLCSKGSTLHLTAAPLVQQQARLQQPMRRAQRGGALQSVEWNVALDEAASRLAAIVERDGADAIGLYLSGQLLTEDYQVFNKLGKGLIGTNNVDTNSRLCMSSAVAGYKASLGADAPPCNYEDIGLARTIFITGSHMAWAHPVLYRRLEDAKAANPSLKVIVADPRRTETAAMADLHLQLLPGTDVVLHHAMLHVLLWEDLVDRAFIAAHTSGFEALRDRVREFTPAHAAKVCGLKAEDIVTAARWFGSHTPTLSLYCQGLNQSTSGTDKNTTLINLHLATGQIGKPGAGPFSLTGQPNAMGGREVGGLANLLPGHRDVANTEHRAEAAKLWGVPELPARPGKAAVEMFQAAAADGQIKALWIVCTNPAQSLPDQAMVRRALERAEFVILQEAYRATATAAYADLLLPATGWGEKEGTVTNSERRITRVRAAVPPLGNARHDWVIARDVAQRIEARWGRAASLFAYADAEAVWNEHREATRGRDLDITGLNYPMLDAVPQQWPCREGEAEGRQRLYEDHRFETADGRARFHAPAWKAPAEPRSAAYPVSLSTGRLRDQWHGMSRSGLVGRLFAHSPEPCVQMHPQELERRHWRAGELVRVHSRRGSIVLPVQADEAVPPAQAFIAMHWGSEYLGGLGVNALMPPNACPQSKQPELKHAAVRIERAVLPWQVVGAAWLPASAWFDQRELLRERFAAFGSAGYASCVPFGREPERIGLLFRAASAAPLPDALTPIEAALGLHEGAVLRYADARAGQRRAMLLSDDGALQAFLLAGDAQAQGWVLDLLQQGLPAAAFGRALLAASASAPQAAAPRSPQVCSCHDVSEARIVATLQTCTGHPDERLRQVQKTLRCGTECGSCLPAVKTLVQRHAAVAEPA